MRGPPFSQFSTGDTSEHTTFGTQILMGMRKFLDDAETRNRQGVYISRGTKKETEERDTECKEEGPIEDLIEDEDKKETPIITGDLQ